MTIQLVSRKEWGARAPKGAYSKVSSTRGVKIHYTGSRVDPGIVDDHSKCVAMVRQIQNHHMDGNGWTDIGYSLVVCPHRKVFVGRGPGNVPAANGPGLNSAHYAVLGLVGSSGLTEPNDDLLHGIVDAIEYLREKGGAGREVKGHLDGYSTSCPGPALYAWVKKGAPRPKSGTSARPAPKPEKTWLEALVDELPLLKPGDKGWAVKRAFYLLASHGKDYVLDPKVFDDTVYGPSMVEKVVAFQRAKGLDPDSLVGKLTWTALIKP